MIRRESGAAVLATIVSTAALLSPAAVVWVPVRRADVATHQARLTVPVRGGALPGVKAEVRPIRLQIAAIGLSATVDPVGVDADGAFEVPPSVDHIGWYRYGPGMTTASGSIVIAGHVDSATQGRGAFFRLREVRRGGRITVTGADGIRREFRVVARKRYDKTKIPLDRYFARDGAARLTLITCGGPFDEATRRYRDNVVVTALPTA